jgi:hypothetical protein
VSSGVAVHPPELADARGSGFAVGGVIDAELVAEAQPAALRPPKVSRLFAHGTVAVLVGAQVVWLVVLAYVAVAIARAH